jgi:uncharacterized protein
MINEIITYRKQGMSFRKIAEILNSTVGKVHYQWVKNVKLLDNQVVLTEPSKRGSSVHKIDCYLEAKLISKHKLFSCWEIAQWQKEQLISYFQDDVNLTVIIFRIYDVTDIYFNGLNAHSYYEFQVPIDRKNWTIKGLKPGRSYLTEVGFYVNRNQFFPILRSNTVYHHLEKFKQTMESLDDQMVQPKWGQQVSTYSYYESNNEAKQDYE